MAEFPASDDERSVDEALTLTSTPAAGVGPRYISSSALFSGGRELAIDHNGRRYQLRITQSGKLILTA